MVLLIAASQMSLAVRERTNEIGALKAIGFGDTQVLVLILVESMALSVVAGGVGLGIAWLLSLGGDPTGGFLPIWVLKPQDIAHWIRPGDGSLDSLPARCPRLARAGCRLPSALRRG